MHSVNVCLQINLAPGDIRYVRQILPHQLRTFGNQVSEIQFTLDTKQSHAFRYATDGYEAKLSEVRAYLAELCDQYPIAKVVDVDYAPARVDEIQKAFMGGKPVPNKACDGSAFYAYLFGIYISRCDYVLHTDSDMFYGGGSQQWIGEAIELLENNRDVLACFPFPGPPRADKTASKRRLTSHWKDTLIEWSCEPTSLQTDAYSYNEVSSRSFLLDRRRFTSGELAVPLVRPRAKRLLRSLLINTSPYLLLEDCITLLMHSRRLRAVGFLGSENGMWSLHPRYRTERFFEELETIISKVESNDIPDGQRGDFDLNSAMIDWSEAYRSATRWKRLRREIELTIAGTRARVRGG